MTTGPPFIRSRAWASIVADQLMPDGRYNLIFRGLARVRILRRTVRRQAVPHRQVDVLHDVVPDDIEELMSLRTALADLILPRITNGPSREQVRGLFQGELPLGQLCDVLAFALPLAAGSQTGAARRRWTCPTEPAS